ESDDPRTTGDAAGHLERGLDGLGPGVREEHAVEAVRHRLGDHLGQATDGLEIALRIAQMNDPIHLLVDRSRHRGVAVAERGDGDPAGEIEVAIAGRVKEAVALPVAPAPLEVPPED